MPWVLLVLAGLFEVAWAIGLKKSEGFSKLGPSLFTAVTLAISMFLLALAVQRLPIGTAYAVWVGIGACGAAIIGMLFLGEPRSAARLFFLALLVVAIVGLKLVTKIDD